MDASVFPLLYFARFITPVISLHSPNESDTKV